MQNNQTISQSKEAQPLVSFIVTVYNLPIQMLCECIDSILALSLRQSEREVIVIDDGSIVSPVNSLVKYSDDIIYIRQKNQGVSAARNTALRMAHGKYIQIIDGDDALIRAPYEHCLDIIRFSGNADMVLFDFSRHRNEPLNCSDSEQPCSGTAYMHNHNIHGSAWSYLFRRDVLGSLRFTPGIRYGEDEEFTPQLLLRSENVYPTTVKAYFYRNRKMSAIASRDSDHVRQRLDDTKTVLLHLQEISYYLPHAERLAMQRRTAQLTMDYIYNTIILTRSETVLNERLAELTDKGLFPLPEADYSTKYVWFRRMTNSRLGISVLLRTLPLLKTER